MRMMAERGDAAVRRGVSPMARDSQKPGEEPGPDSSIPGEGGNSADILPLDLELPALGPCLSPACGAAAAPANEHTMQKLNHLQMNQRFSKSLSHQVKTMCQN